MVARGEEDMKEQENKIVRDVTIHTQQVQEQRKRSRDKMKRGRKGLESIKVREGGIKKIYI